PAKHIKLTIKSSLNGQSQQPSSVLTTLISIDLDHQQLIKAFHETAKAKKIGNLTLSQGEAIPEELKTAPGMALSWKSYQQTKKFAQDIRFTRVLDSARKQLTQIFSAPQTEK
ncbi:hypothetical protein ABC903_13125, partial [Lacticaseibacillus rhamnosus]